MESIPRRCVRNLEMGMSRSLSPRTSGARRQKSKKRGTRDRMLSKAGEMIRVVGQEEEAAEHLEQPHSTHNWMYNGKVIRMRKNKYLAFITLWSPLFVFTPVTVCRGKKQRKTKSTFGLFRSSAFHLIKPTDIPVTWLILWWFQKGNNITAMHSETDSIHACTSTGRHTAWLFPLSSDSLQPWSSSNECFCCAALSIKPQSRT